MKDLDFIAGNYLYDDIPLDKEYLCFYFETDLERKFLSYCLLFFDDIYLAEKFQRFFHNFVDHTGYSCSDRWVRKLLKKYKELELALSTACKNVDLPEITRIKTGNYSNLKSVSETSIP